MPPVPFSQIPANNLLPFYFVEFDNSNAGVAGGQLQKSLLIAQTINVVPATIVYVPSPQWAANTFGAGSQLAIMAAAYYAADPAGELWAYPLADAAGSAAATGNISFTGPATGNGTVFIMVAGREVQVGVTTGMTAAQIATAAVAAVNAYLDPNGMALPVTAAIDVTHNYQVDFTARNKGLVSNQIFLGLNFYGSQAQEVLPPGVGATVTAFTGGATDPDLAAVGAAMGTTPYDFIMLPGYTGTTQLNEMQTLMSFNGGRWSYSQQLFGHVFNAYQSTGFSGSDLLTFGATRNDPHMDVFGYEGGSPSTPFEIVASSTGAFAQASKADPGRPEQTLPCPYLIAAPPNARFGFNTQQSLLSTGIALLQPHRDSSMALLRAVTTYQTNSWGQTDRSYLDATIMFMIMFYVRQQKANVTQKFPRSKLAQDGTNFGQQGNFGVTTPSIVTPKVMKSELIANYIRMCPGGDLPTIVQDPASYAANLQVQINGANQNRLDILDDPIFIGGLRMVAVLNQFRLIDAPLVVA